MDYRKILEVDEMKINLRLESSQFRYVYSKYKIDGKKYIMPDENVTKK